MTTLPEFKNKAAQQNSTSIAPQAPPDPPPKAPTKAAPPKEHVKDLVGVKIVRRGKAVGHARTPPLHPVILAVAVIGRSLLGVCQAAECLGHLCSSNRESGQGSQALKTVS